VEPRQNSLDRDRETRDAREWEDAIEAEGSTLEVEERARFRSYVEALIAEIDPERVRSPASLVTLVRRLYTFARRRAEGELLLRVHNSPECPDRSVIQLIQEDRPFLVDTVRMALRRLGLREFFLIHPIVAVARGQDGTLRELGSGRPESVIYAEVLPRMSDESTRARVEAELREVMGDVRRITDDHRRMVRRVRELAADVEYTGAVVEGGVERAAKISRFLAWLLEDRFLFVGIRHYTVHSVDGVPEVGLELDSGLGLWRGRSASFFTKPKRGNEVPREIREILSDRRIVLIDKSRVESRIHRPGRLDRIVVRKHDERGQIVGLTIVLGLFTFRALRTPGSQIPLLAERLEAILAEAAAPRGSHRHKAIVAAFDSAPVELLLGSDAEGIAALISEIVAAEGSEETHLVMRSNRTGRSFYAAVLLPRQLYREEFRGELRELFAERTGATYFDDRVSFIEETTALLHFFATSAAGRLPLPPVAELEREVRQRCATWEDRLRRALAAHYGEEQALELGVRYEDAFPEGFQVATDPADAVRDVAALEALNANDEPQFTLYYDRRARAGDATTLRIFLPAPRLLSELLPVVDSFGIRVIDAQQSRVEPARREVVALVSLRILPLGAVQEDLDAIAPRLFDALAAALTEAVQWDRLNGLVLGAGLSWREVDCLRAYLDYFQQVQGTLERPFVRTVLLENPLAVRTLVRYHAARFEPDVSEAQRAGLTAELRAQFEAYRDRIMSLNEDRALLAFFGLIEATLRTNFFAEVQTDHTIAFKIDPARVPEVQPPYPYREIFVHAAAFRGIHIRGGPVSRGGLRWSDRADDLRTEILGLARTQMLKNGLIVPVGAKGGFVLKRLGLSPREARAEADRQYRVFVTALLELTDNLGPDGEIKAPPRVVRHDGDDPYLVVAADKGTAHLSDAANDVALAHRFWLGDAFASGGSDGYDHKKYAITARGAWECVLHHFRELGIDVERDSFTIAGIGDMSGDVFGNGMLLARRGRLVAAFDHRHIFLDPNPDPEISWRERQRLFELPGSSWADYDASRISPGGGVYPRGAKRIPLVPEIRGRLDCPSEALTGDALVSAILAAPVDLLWNGGIGTYVKASRQSHSDVGDRANDAVRIGATQLRARVVAEGGNLGLTQAARIEAAAAGVHLNTDAIDNSAGVDLSDHEVNFKILVAPLVRTGELSTERRRELLAEVADAACEQVLTHNRGQALSLSLDQLRSERDIEPFEQVAATLCEDAGMTPSQLGLPSAAVWERRRRSGTGLLRPELASLLGLAKLHIRRQLAESSHIEHPALRPFFVGYFPPALRQLGEHVFSAHPLRAEITALAVASRLVDVYGAARVLSFAAEVRLPVEAVSAAIIGAERLLRAAEPRAELLQLPLSVSRQAVYRALALIEGAVENVARLLSAADVDPLDVELLERWQDGLLQLSERAEGFVSPFDRAKLAEREAELVQSGIPAALASFVARLPLADRGLNIVQVSEACSLGLLDAARVYVELGEAVGLDVAYQRLPELEGRDAWDRVLARSLRNELLELQKELTQQALTVAEADRAHAAKLFLEAHRVPLDRLGELQGLVIQEPNVSAWTLWVRALQRLRAKADS